MAAKKSKKGSRAATKKLSNSKTLGGQLSLTGRSGGPANA